MRERQTAGVPEDERRDLDVPDAVGPDDAVVDRPVGGAEDVAAVAERVGDEIEGRLPLVGERREVVGVYVGQGDLDVRWR